MKNNAAGRKDPWGDRADGAGKGEGVAGMTGPKDPAVIIRARKPENCNAGYGRQPSEHRVGVFTPCMTILAEVTFCKRRGDE